MVILKYLSIAVTKTFKKLLTPVPAPSVTLSPPVTPSPRKSMEFFAKQLKLLELEREEELKQAEEVFQLTPSEQEHLGVCIQKVRLQNIRCGLFGRKVAEFAPTSKTKMGNHTFGNGDNIAVLKQKGEDVSETGMGSYRQGILSHINNDEIAVSFSFETNLSDLEEALTKQQLFRLVQLSNDLTYKRLKKGLQVMTEDSSSNASARGLRKILLDSEEVTIPPPVPIPAWTPVNPSLNEQQKAAVDFALSQRNLAIIHGPPGTGKTSTVVEIILQMLRLWPESRILVTAPSNVAVDNLLQKLAAVNTENAHNKKNCVRLLRLGHPSRTSAELQQYTIDAQLERCDSRELILDIRNDLTAVYRNEHIHRREKQRDVRKLCKDLKKVEKNAMNDLLQNAQVVLSTLTGNLPYSSMISGNLKFDMVIIDEVSQATEAACWLAIPFSEKLVIAGDHQQLPPTVKSQKAIRDGFGVSLMERILAQYSSEDVSRLLVQQYRMHNDIMRWSSDNFYASNLVCHPSVESRLLQDLLSECVQSSSTEKCIDIDSPFQTAVRFIDTEGCEMYETQSTVRLSIGNPGEVAVVCAVLCLLLYRGLNADHVGVITPYSRQVELLRWALTDLADPRNRQSVQRLIVEDVNYTEDKVKVEDVSRVQKELSRVEVRTVDGFQGREKEAIIISLVRSNEDGEVGFLGELRRLNVALTRAKRHLCIVGDSSTVALGNAKLSSLMRHLHDKAQCSSAAEYAFALDCVLPDEDMPLPKPAAPRQKPKKLSADAATVETLAAALKVKEDFKRNKPLLQKQVETFVKDESVKSLEFPETLSNMERHFVHELCQSLGLLHKSHGKANCRKLVIVKPSSASPETQHQAPTPLPEPEEQLPNVPSPPMSSTLTVHNEIRAADPPPPVPTPTPVVHEKIRANDSRTPTPVVHEKVPGNEPPTVPTSASLVQDEVRATAHQRIQQQQSKKQAQEKKPTSFTKPSSSVKVSKLSSAIQDIAGDDLDAILEAIDKVEGSCAFTEATSAGQRKCKHKVRTQGYECPYCKARFCMQHFMPEMHGCGDAARTAARRDVANRGMAALLGHATSTANSFSAEAKRAQLKIKLHKGIVEKEAQRARKTEKK